MVSLVFEIPSGSFLINFGYNLLVLSISIFYFIIFVKEKRFEVSYFFSFLFLMVFFTIYSFIDVKVSISYILLFSVNFILGWLFYKFCKDDIDKFLKGLNFVILFHCFFLFLQYILINFINININFHEILFPFSSGHTYQLKGIDYIRITGIYNEPGTYSTWMAILVSWSMILKKNIKLIHYIGFSSIALTFSATGFIFFIAFLLLVLFKESNKFKVKNFAIGLFFICIAYILILYSGMLEYIKWRFFDDTVVDGTSDLKFAAFNFLFQSEFPRQFFGSGLGVNDCLECKSIQDVGLLFNYIFYFGFLAIIPLFIILKNIFKINIFILFILILLASSKLFLYTNIFWISIFIIYLVGRNREV